MDENTEDLAKLAAARREARIQRILGNSKNRLNKIAGKETTENLNGMNKIIFDIVSSSSFE